MALIQTNTIGVEYKLLNTQELDQIANKLQRIGTEDQKLLSEMRQMNAQFKANTTAATQSANATQKGIQGVEGQVGKLNGTLKSVGGFIAGAFTVAAIVSFGQSIFKVTAEFEKMQAVLKNTLGSNSAAMLSMETIKNFAKSTPFSVQELTASFVKLANQGFIPTIDQMKMLGDLASSTGKTFDQLAEAIIDGQVGEFERLKEFGIRAAKSGDQVKFTFKGVETQVKFNNAAIRDYIVSLGELNGVSGSAAAISETLGGKVNNLGDAWDNFLNKIGTLLKPILTEALTVTADFMDGINSLFGNAKSDSERFGVAELETYKYYQGAVLKMTDDQLINFVAKQKEGLESSQKDLIKYTKESLKYGKATRLAAESGFGQGEIIDAIKSVEQANQDIAATKGRIAAAEEQIALREKASKTTQLGLTDAELKALKNQYELRVKALELEKKIAEEKIMARNADGFERDVLIQRNNLKFGQDRLKVDREFSALKVEDAQKNIKLQISLNEQYLNDAVRILKAETDEHRKELTKQFEDMQEFDRKRGADQDEQVRKQKEHNQELIELERKKEKAIADIDKESKEEAAKFKKEIDDITVQEAQATVMVLNTISDGLYAAQATRLNNELIGIQRNADEEVRLADGNLQKVNTIREKQAAKEKELRIKQFQAEKQQAIANVIFRIAPIIAEYFATGVLAPLAIGAIAAGAAQIALIAAQPIPAFKEGTKGRPHKGLAIVGDGGESELITTQSGTSTWSPSKATLAYFSEPTHVTPKSKLPRELFTSSILAGSRSNGKDGLILKELTDLNSNVKGLPIHQVNMNKKGFETWVRTPNRATKILDNQFK